MKQIKSLRIRRGSGGGDLYCRPNEIRIRSAHNNMLDQEEVVVSVVDVWASLRGSAAEVRLTVDQAKRLHNWLNQWVEEQEGGN